jgi:hypothetical protein
MTLAINLYDFSGQDARTTTSSFEDDQISNVDA